MGQAVTDKLRVGLPEKHQILHASIALEGGKVSATVSPRRIPGRGKVQGHEGEGVPGRSHRDSSTFPKAGSHCRVSTERRVFSFEQRWKLLDF